MSYFRQFGIGAPTIGTPMANTLDTLTELTTGKPAVGPSGRTPAHVGYDPLESTWDALTTAPITSDIVEVTVEIVEEAAEITEDIIDAVEQILSFVGEAATALGKAATQSLHFFEWMLDHPAAIIIGGVVILGGVVYIATR